MVPQKVERKVVIVVVRTASAPRLGEMWRALSASAVGMAAGSIETAERHAPGDERYGFCSIEPDTPLVDVKAWISRRIS